jgi:hypothetical protein
MEKIEPARQAFLAKVKMPKPVLIVLRANQQIKVLMLNQVKMLVLETVRVQRHVALDVESRDKYEYIY